VHPTQLYEVAALLFIFWLLWRLRRHEHAVGWLFGAYLVAIGVERFLVEFVRAKDDRFLGVFTLAQATSIVLLIVGLALMRWLRTPDGFTPRPVDGLAPRTTD
ncbi:MAG: prolipoprotein diacylglyceryl transferase, partial [Gemmatimonadota bacterium]|nr:prolipoprotein diacylglyceryl transferase [Gemmatimonadota bacterium]